LGGIGARFRDFEATATDGTPIDTRDYRGRPLLLLYWGFW